MFAGCVILVMMAVGGGMAQPHSSHCSLNIHVQPHFDSRKFVGRWNELMWVAPLEEKEYDATDYFWILENRTTDGVIRGIQSGRDLHSGACFGGPLNLTETSTPGVLLLDANNGYITRYYVLSTDYVTYANVYGCYVYDSDATRCYRGRAWLWSRGTTLSDRLHRKALDTWAHLCLDLNSLLKYTTFHGNDCPV